MKKLISLAILFMMILATSFDATGQISTNTAYKPKVKPKGGSSVEAPLDGGVLTLLGAAGIAYMVARKKKKQSEV
jgi:hypothetical protein